MKSKHKYLIDNTDKPNKAEKALIRSEVPYRNLVENSADIIYLADTQGRIIFMNRGGLDLFETSEEEMIGRKFDEPGIS